MINQQEKEQFWYSKPHRPSFATKIKSISYNNWQETVNLTDTIFKQDEKNTSTELLVVEIDLQ